MAYRNLKEIDAGITKLRGLTKNVNNMVQEIAVGIVAHAFGTGEGQGSGDVSRATKLVKALPNSFRREYLIRWFKCAGIAINPSKDYSASVVKSDSKAYRPANERIDFANSNKWFDAVTRGEDGKDVRADWYQGAMPKDQEPNTLVDFATNVHRFADRMNEQVHDASKFRLSDEQIARAERILGLIKRAGNAITDEARLADLEREMNDLNQRIEQERELLNGAPTYDEVADTQAA